MQTIAVDPIRQGFAFSFSLKFTGANGAPLGFSLLTAQRIVGQFRRKIGEEGEPLATVDTANNTLSVTAVDTISFTLSSNVTANFPAGKTAYIDFARLVSDSWIYMPPIIPWPVADTVTIPPVT